MDSCLRYFTRIIRVERAEQWPLYQQIQVVILISILMIQTSQASFYTTSSRSRLNLRQPQTQVQSEKNFNPSTRASETAPVTDIAQSVNFHQTESNLKSTSNQLNSQASKIKFTVDGIKTASIQPLKSKSSIQLQVRIQVSEASHNGRVSVAVAISLKWQSSVYLKSTKRLWQTALGFNYPNPLPHVGWCECEYASTPQSKPQSTDNNQSISVRPLQLHNSIESSIHQTYPNLFSISVDERVNILLLIDPVLI